jgi:amino acid transporter
MDRTPPRALKSLISILLVFVIVFAIVVAIISVSLGYAPSWALAILFVSFIALVVFRIVALAGFGYPRYDFSRLYDQNKELKEKKK